MKEIIIIGRGGQGGKSAAAILAEAALDRGNFIQSFSEYGAERQGAPVYSYCRIDDREIRIHSGVTRPDIVAVIDPTLISQLSITEDMADDGIIVLNTTYSPKEVRDKMNIRKCRIFTVNATQISIDCFGKAIPNTPMLGAIERAASLVTLDGLKKKITNKFLRKIGEEAVRQNIAAIERAYNEVKEG